MMTASLPNQREVLLILTNQREVLLAVARCGCSLMFLRGGVAAGAAAGAAASAARGTAAVAPAAGRSAVSCWLVRCGRFFGGGGGGAWN